MGKLYLGSQEISPLIVSKGGDDTTLWIGSAKNPEYVDTYTLTVNLQDDTTYSSITPSNTAQVVFAAAQAEYLTTGPTLDMANYRYIVFEDIIVPHEYSTSASGLTHVDCVAHKGAYVIGRRNTGAASSLTAPTYNSAANNCNFTMLSYYTTADVLSVASSSYGVYATLSTPTLSNGSSDTPVLNFPNPSITVRSSSSYMAVNAFNHLDASATNIRVRWQVYRISKPSMLDVASDLCTNAALDKDFQDNIIYLGDL